MALDGRSSSERFLDFCSIGLPTLTVISRLPAALSGTKPLPSLPAEPLLWLSAATIWLDTFVELHALLPVFDDAAAGGPRGPACWKCSACPNIGWDVPEGYLGGPEAALNKAVPEEGLKDDKLTWGPVPFFSIGAFVLANSSASESTDAVLPRSAVTGMLSDEPLECGATSLKGIRPGASTEALNDKAGNDAGL
jgi:hypothetical protein